MQILWLSKMINVWMQEHVNVLDSEGVSALRGCMYGALFLIVGRYKNVPKLSLTKRGSF